MSGSTGALRGITIWDVLLASVFAAAAVAVLLLTLASGRGGGSVELESGGETIGVYSLSEDRELTVENGGYVNVVVISGGSVSVISASCPDQYCVKHRPISYENECIVCLPARLVITVTAGEEAPFDAYTS